MNDRFKFRFWHKSNKRYINSEKLVLNDRTYTQVGTKQMNNGTYCSYIINEYNASDIIPEQCTGLKDKNGKLIYEGDIVRTSDCYQDGVYKIGWNEEDAEYDLYNKDNYFIYQLVNRFNSVEVIGNIHKNEGLIKEGEYD